MSASALEINAPLISQLSPPPGGEFLTDSQWKTLMAIADTVIPSIGVSSHPSPHGLAIDSTEYATAVENLEALIPEVGDRNLAQRYLEERPSVLPGFTEFLHRLLGQYMREDARRGLRMLLSALE
jgi:hypothetical protein